MNFATPIAFAWTALTIPIVLFYILKTRMRQVPVSTTIFWQQIYDEKSPRSWWQQFRHWLSLITQLLWLALLTIALAEPYFPRELLQARRVVLVIDNSASMNATDISPTRLAAAKAKATKYIASLRFRDEMAIVAAGTQPQVVCGFTGHERTLQQGIDKVEASEGPTAVADAVDLAKRLLTDAKRGQVIVFSDGCFEGSDKLTEDKLITLQHVGNKTANVGITRLQVRRSILDPVGYEILVEVFNASDDPTEVRLEMDLNDSAVDVIPLKLKAGEVWSQAIEKVSTTGGKLVARLKQSDSLLADNQAFALLPHRTPQKICLISNTNNLFLQKALEANPLVELQTLKELPKTYAPGVIHVFHRHVPKVLPSGPIFVVDPVDSCDLWQVSEPLENPIITKQETDSPLMRNIRLDNVILPSARKLIPTGDAKVLAGAVNDEPLFFSSERPDGKVLVLSVNLDEGDLTFRTAFPILVANGLGWFAGQAGELRESLVAGSVTEIEIPPAQATTQPLLFHSPSGKTKPWPEQLTKTSLGPVDEVGIWKVQKQPDPKQPSQSEATAAPLVELACNLASRAETDLRPPAAWQQHAKTETIIAGWFVRPLWFYLIGFAWLVAIVEWFLYQRRWIS